MFHHSGIKIPYFAFFSHDSGIRVKEAPLNMLLAMGITAAPSENAEIFITDLGKWLEVRSRYLNWVDGRLAQMVIATDITARRKAEEQAALQAERANHLDDDHLHGKR